MRTTKRTVLTRREKIAKEVEDLYGEIEDHREDICDLEQQIEELEEEQDELDDESDPDVEAIPHRGRTYSEDGFIVCAEWLNGCERCAAEREEKP